MADVNGFPLGAKMSVALEDSRHKTSSETRRIAEDAPDADEEHLSSLFVWWAIAVLISIGSVVLGLAHRS